MKFTIINERQNPHIKRKELTLSIEHIGGATPSLQGLQTLLSKEFGIEQEKIEIKNIFSLKGQQKSKGRVFIWEEKKVDNLSVKNEPKKEGEAEQKAE